MRTPARRVSDEVSRGERGAASADQNERRRGGAGAPRLSALAGLIVMACSLAWVAPAWASVSFDVTPTFPSPVAVAQSGLPASIQITNHSTPPENAGKITIDSLNLVPACGADLFAGSGNCPAADADPGVFQLSATGTGEAGTGCAGQTFTITLTDPSTGQVTFTANSGPIVVTAPTTPDSVCRIDFTFTVLKEPSNPVSMPTSSSAVTDQIGYARGTSAVDGATAAGSGSGSVTVGATSTPTIVTTASAPVMYGATISASAMLSGGLNPGGTIEFTAFGPNDPMCSESAAFSSSGSVSGDATYDAAAFTPTAVGTYQFVAFYGGDANNSAVSSGCGASGASVVVSPAPLTVNAPSASVYYGAVPASFAPAYTGLEDGDTAPSTPPRCGTTATDSSAPGRYPITCSGAIDSNYSIGYGPAGLITISKAPTKLVAAPAKFGLLSITFSAKLTRPDSGAAVPGKTIVFSVKGRRVCQAATNSSGLASCAAIGLPLGPASYTASYAGDADYIPSSATGKL